MIWRQFPARADTGLVIGVATLWLLLSLSLGWLLVQSWWGQPQVAVRWAVVVGAVVVAFLVLLRSIAYPTYALGTHEVLVRVGFLRLRFPYRRIEMVEEADVLAPIHARLPLFRRLLVPSRLMLRVAAKPILLHLRWGMFRVVYISPRERDTFVDLLRMRAPDLTVKVAAERTGTRPGKPDSSGAG